jgi:hypothetical protein
VDRLKNLLRAEPVTIASFPWCTRVLGLGAPLLEDIFFYLIGRRRCLCSVVDVAMMINVAEIFLVFFREMFCLDTDTVSVLLTVIYLSF